MKYNNMISVVFRKIAYLAITHHKLYRSFNYVNLYIQHKSKTEKAK